MTNTDIALEPLQDLELRGATLRELPELGERLEPGARRQRWRAAI